VIAFLVFLVLGVVLGGWTVNQRAAPGTAARALATKTDFALVSPFRRVALMPGAPVLES
jgi:hypothetical protein